MNPHQNPRQSTRPDPWSGALAGLGFLGDRELRGFRLDGVFFSGTGDWRLLEAPAGRPDGRSIFNGIGFDEIGLGEIGRPGLWKLVGGGDAGPLRQVFDLPCALPQLAASAGGSPADLPEAEREDSEPSALLKWALGTRSGELPSGWNPPPPSEIESWIPPGGLTLQCGHFVRQGSIVCSPSRIALSFPVVTSLAACLSQRRQSWLREILADAQNEWRMVRVGFTAPSGGSVLAEVDLSGAPASALEPFIKIALGALRFVVSWIGPSAELVSNPNVSSRALEVLNPRALPEERSLS